MKMTIFRVKNKKGTKTIRAKYSRLNKRWYIQKLVAMKSFFGLMQYSTWVTMRDPWMKVLFFESEAAIESYINNYEK